MVDCWRALSHLEGIDGVHYVKLGFGSTADRAIGVFSRPSRFIGENVNPSPLRTFQGGHNGVIQRDAQWNDILSMPRRFSINEIGK